MDSSGGQGWPVEVVRATQVVVAGGLLDRRKGWGGDRRKDESLCGPGQGCPLRASVSPPA